MDFALTKQKTVRASAQVAVVMFFVAAACRPEEANGPGPSPDKIIKVSPSASSGPSGTPKALWTQEQLEAAFSASSDVLFAAKTPADFLKFQVLQQADIAAAAEGLSVKATGNDPSLIVPEFPSKPCIAKVEISSPANTNIQIFYLVAGQTIYDEAHSVVVPLKAGANVVYLSVEDSNLTGKWRLDPGDALGNYLLQGFEVRAKSAEVAP